MKPLNVLLFSTLFPNAVQFRHGIFIANRLQQIQKAQPIHATVVAPVAWFPVKCSRFPAYSQLLDVPGHEQRDGVDVWHPRYVVIPKIGMTVTPLLLAISAYRQIRRLQQQGQQFDVIDAHYFYPDGVAAALLAKWLRLPLVITARGSDINLISDYAMPRRMMQWASRVASANLAVSQALADKMRSLAMPNVQVAPNGVDAEVFQPQPRPLTTGKQLLCVGNLVELKGQDLLIRALAELPEYQLTLVGAGPDAAKLGALAEQLGLSERVRFLGEVPQAQLPTLYSQADALLLPSSREGWPNVLLEAMACGTPVIATPVGACPEIVTCPEAGVLCAERSVPAIVNAIQQLFSNYPDRQQTRQHALGYAWQSSVEVVVRAWRSATQLDQQSHRS